MFALVVSPLPSWGTPTLVAFVAVLAGLVTEDARRQERAAARRLEEAQAAHQVELAAQCGEWSQKLTELQRVHEGEMRHLVDVRLTAAVSGERALASPQQRWRSRALCDLADQAVRIASTAYAAHQEQCAAHQEQCAAHQEQCAAHQEQCATYREQSESQRVVMVALAKRVQTSAHRIQQKTERLYERASAMPGAEAAAEQCMSIDHEAAQQARQAQSVAVLCGDYPGQQWPGPRPLVDLVRAGASRIRAYQRVDITGDQEIALVPGVAEPLVHSVAELLDNATFSSPPNSRVQATVRAVANGAVIEIDDEGLGLDEHELPRLAEVASGRRLMELSELGETPRTGLAVVGRFARRHGLGVSLRPSDYGGVRAVMLIPKALLCPPTDNRLRPAATPAVTAAPLPQRSDSAVQAAAQAKMPAAPQGAADAAAGTTSQAGPPAAAGAATPSGLPRRRSPRHSAPPARPSTPPARTEAPATPEPTPEETGQWMGAYFGHSSPQHPAPAAPSPEQKDDA